MVMVMGCNAQALTMVVGNADVGIGENAKIGDAPDDGIVVLARGALVGVGALFERTLAEGAAVFQALGLADGAGNGGLNQGLAHGLLPTIARQDRPSLRSDK